MRRLACFLWICALAVTSYAAPKDKLNKLSFSFEGRTRTYYSFIPDDPAPLPVVVLLHGSGRNGEEMADPWKSLAASEHFIIVAPNAWNSAGWDSQYDSPAFLHEVVNQLKATHPVDASRIYLFGHSAGAVFALGLALIDSEYYAATAIHAGAMSPQNRNLFARAQRHMPIAIWVGDHDAFFPVETVKATQAMFDANGFHVELTIVPNHTHTYDEVSDKVDRQAWDFLSKTRLSPSDTPLQP